MQSSLISKIEKAKRYAQEPGRIHIYRLNAGFHGEHGNYLLDYADGRWHCSCPYFSQHATCSHTMALERLLGPMLAPPGQP